MCRVFLLVCLLKVCLAARVLVVFPAPSRSHAVLGDSVVDILLQAGHEVTYVSAHGGGAARAPRLHRVDVSSLADTLTDRERLNLMELARNPRPPQRVMEVGTTFAHRALQHEAVRKLLHDPELSFDLVLAEWFYTGLLAPLASLYECPLIWYSAVDASWLNLQLVHGQTNPAYTADPQDRNRASAALGMRDRMDRLWRQAYLNGWVYYMRYYVEASAYQEVYRTAFQLRARVLPMYEELVHSAVLLLINSHPLLGQVVPLPQNAKYVGGHHIEIPTKPLPINLQNVLDKSKNGVIFFSLGSNIKSKGLTTRVKRELLDVFGQLEQTVVWKYEEPLDTLPRNVHIVKWAPQTSILNHSNTLLFITHGGLLSYSEATYFGVPIVGIPIFGDQFLTMDLAESRGRGIRVDFTERLAFKIKDAVNEILGNYSYTSNSKQASAIFTKNLVSPQKELLYWVELVMHHGAEHLRSPALQLTVPERLHLDVVAFVFMFAWFLTKVAKVIRVHWNSQGDEDKKNE